MASTLAPRAFISEPLPLPILVARLIALCYGQFYDRRDAETSVANHDQLVRKT